MVIHFPEDGDLRPFYGLVYSQLGDAPLEQVGYAEAQLTVPIDRRLTLQAYEPGRYGRPFQGLPPDLFDRIVATQMGPKTTDDDMEAFSDLYQTRQLSIGYTYEAGRYSDMGRHTPFRIAGLGHLARFERLKELGLKSRLVTDRGLAVLAKLPPLRSLQLCYAEVTPTGLGGLPIDELTSLTVEWTIKIGTNLGFLRRCKDLETLGLRISGTNDAQLRHVGVLGHLTKLDVAHNSPDERFGVTEAVTDDGVAHLRDMPNLHTLYLEGTAVTDRCAEHLRTLPNLKKLSIGQSAITDRFVAEISSMHQLEDLSLMGSEVTNRAFDYLADLPDLKVLNVGATKVNHDGLDQVARIKSLEHINLTGTNVLARESGRLSILPHLKKLEVWYQTESKVLQDRIQNELPGVRVMFEH